MILVIFTSFHGYIRPNKNKLVNLQELILLINLTMLYAASYQCSGQYFLYYYKYHDRHSYYTVFHNSVVSFPHLHMSLQRCDYVTNSKGEDDEA